MTGNTDFEGGIFVFGGELNEWKSSLPYLLNVQRTKSVALASLECWSCAKMQAFISFVVHVIVVPRVLLTTRWRFLGFRKL
jgi:hypothetical protein